MTRSPFARIIAAVFIIGAVYLLARTTGWTGPHAHVPLVDEVMWPAVLLVTAWGLYRVMKGGGR